MELGQAGCKLDSRLRGNDKLNFLQDTFKAQAKKLAATMHRSRRRIDAHFGVKGRAIDKRVRRDFEYRGCSARPAFLRKP
jgi:hypothetical protein